MALPFVSATATVTSKDGTVIAYDRQGSGPPVILIGTPEDAVTEMRSAPFWPALEGLAPTLAYEAACLGDGEPPTGRLVHVSAPTLVLTGRAGPGAEMRGLPADFFDVPARHRERDPRATWERLDGQAHVADPDVVAAVLAPYFTT